MLAPVRRSARLKSHHDKMLQSPESCGDGSRKRRASPPAAPNPARKRPRIARDEVEDEDIRVRDSDPADQEPRQKAQGVGEREATRYPTPQPTFRDQGHHHPVRHWVASGRWPINYSSMAPKKKNGPQKRGRSGSRSSSSYTESVRNGQAPRAHSLASEPRLLAAGIHIQLSEASGLLSEESKKYTEMLLEAGSYETPTTLFPIEKFQAALGLLATRNESRVFRDLTPLLVPSAEHLFLSGEQHLKHAIEELDTLWKYVQPMGSSVPQPDMVVGLSRSAFTAEEATTLDYYASLEYETQFTDLLYFPFLVCEVKGVEQTIARAERQASHAAGIAAKAVWQLTQYACPDRLNEIKDSVLVFSVVHDNSIVKIFGHFPHVDEGSDTPSFYRHPIFKAFLDDDNRVGQKKVYSFVRALYDKFFSRHLRRIREMLAAIEAPPTTTSGTDVGDDNEAEGSVFKVPTASASQMLVERNQGLVEQNQGLMEQNKGLIEQIKLLTEQLEARRKEEEARRKEEDARHQQSQQQIATLIDLLKPKE